MKEIWKDIPDYEGLYQVSNLGRIRSLDREIIQWNGFDYVKMKYKGKIIKATTTNRGYQEVCLSKNGKQKGFSVHRLVAFSFIANSDKNLTVDHIDGNKQNNKIENLRVVTLKKNIQLSFENNLHKLKKVGKYNLDNQLLEVYKSCSDASRKNKCSPSIIIKCCNQKKYCKTAKGFIWRYINEEEV